MTLTRAVAVCLIAQLLATLWAVVYRLPFEVGGHGAPDHVLRDFWTRGTAISAPAPFLLVLGLLTLAARRRGRLGGIATAVIVPLMIVGFAAGVVEPALRQATGRAFPLPERIGILVLSGVSLAAALLVVFVAARQLRDRIARGETSTTRHGI